MRPPPAVPARTPPHAPFRAGAPRFVPALTPIAPAGWLTPDTEAHVLPWKQALLDRPERVVRARPDAEPVLAEAADRVGAALNVAVRGDLVAASRQVSDDLVVMVRRNGAWTCAGLTLTAPTFFAIDAVIGRDLCALHAPVPDAHRLSARIARVFDAVRPDQVLERFNWTLQAGPARFTPDAAPLHAAARAAAPDAALDLLHLRVERQTIVKLPRSGAVLFTIRVCLDPLRALAPGDRPALAAAWRAAGSEGRRYKGWAAYEAVAEAAFRAWGV